MDSVSETRLDEVHPILASKIRQMADQLAQEGITIRVTQGLRSWTQQLALWMQGRDMNGTIVNPSKVVTKAAPGYSWHCFGLAVDVAPFVQSAAGQLPDWNLSHPVWKRIVAVGQSLGLFSGSEFRTFPDWPHFQLTGSCPESPDDEVRQTFKDGGMLAVWDLTGLSSPQNGGQTVA